MRLPNSYFVAAALVSHWALAGCSSSSKPTSSTQTNDSGEPSTCTDANANQSTTGEFTVSLVPAANGANGTGNNQAYTNIAGHVYDGPVPETIIDTELAAPADATPGCAVFLETIPDCTGIGKCGSGSSNAACAAAATTGINTCVCVAQDTCQAYPTLKNVGTVTVSGVADTSGEMNVGLTNLSNSYQVPGATTLQYPGFSPGDPIKISTTCGDYPPFEISAKGIAPLTLTNGPPFNIAKDTSSSDPTKYQAFTLTWIPQDSVGDSGAPSEAGIHVEINLSHHAGSVGHLACDVDDTGSLTISAGLISQLIGLGHIAGYPELDIQRISSGSAAVAHGSVNLVVESSITAPTLTVEGYISCGDYNVNVACPTGQVCNTTTKLCIPG